MKTPFLAILAGVLVSSPALAGGNRNDSAMSSSTICALATPTHGSDRKYGTMGVPYEVYLDYVAAGGQMSWNQFVAYVTGTCSG